MSLSPRLSFATVLPAHPPLPLQYSLYPITASLLLWSVFSCRHNENWQDTLLCTALLPLLYNECTFSSYCLCSFPCFSWSLLVLLQMLLPRLLFGLRPECACLPMTNYICLFNCRFGFTLITHKRANGKEQSHLLFLQRSSVLINNQRRYQQP